MQELLLATAAGLAGAPHCIGMCGGLVTSVTVQSRSVLWRTTLAYHSGRLITYSLTGALMGAIGSFVDAAGRIAGLQGIASIAGGLLMLLWVRTKYSLPLQQASPMRFAAVRRAAERLRSGSPSAVFLSGILLGFIPCGLTYAMQINAAAAGNAGKGALLLAAFGLGTLPALLLVTFLAASIRKPLRSRLRKAGDLLVIAIALLAVLRGMAANGWVPTISPWLW